MTPKHSICCAILSIAVTLCVAGAIIAADKDEKSDKTPLTAPRFTILDTNCVIDNKTGLMWARNASLTGTNQLSWSETIAFCKNLDYGGYKDWRLPHIREFWDLIHTRYPRLVIPNTAGTDQMKENDPFRGVQTISGRRCYYWATTTTAGEPAGPWLITMFDGAVATGQGCETNTGWVWPVRSVKK